MKKEKIYYKALQTKDHRFDGKFFIGVKTTGIYCRPICPALPKPENIIFFNSQIEAERAGFRPCLRCRPESAPRSPAWIGKSAVVQRAVKMLATQEAIDLDENEFADRFGITARHLRRLFIDEIGKTPKQLSFENRLNLARKLITETHLSITEAAFASGFKSIRRFNDAFKNRFKRSPSEIRRIPITHKEGLKISLSYRPPFNFAGLLAHYQSHHVGDLEWFEQDKMHRIIAFDQSVGQITLSDDANNARLLVEIDFPDTTKIHAIISRVRAMFDLDSDPIVIANALEIDKKFKSMLKKHVGIRLPSGWDSFEIAIATILGQLVSVERGSALVADLINLLGEESGIIVNGKNIKLFPSPHVIASANLEKLKTTAVRKKTLKAFSNAIAHGSLSLEPTQEVDVFLEKVLSLPGIGPWTASYMALKCLRHTDAFPETDLILARALKLHPKATLEKMSPWQGYAAALLWKEYAKLLKKPREMKMNKAQWQMKSIIGPLYLVASDKGLQGVFWNKQDVPMTKSLEKDGKEIRILAETVHQLEEYFSGKRKTFNLTFDISGTAFQQSVWKELSKIPYGETRSYKDIAHSIKNDKAVRAVGTANGRNPLSIIVPCHRVIAADKSLGGYAGGLGIKAQLLQLEKGEDK